MLFCIESIIIIKENNDNLKQNNITGCEQLNVLLLKSNVAKHNPNNYCSLFVNCTESFDNLTLEKSLYIYNKRIGFEFISKHIMVNNLHATDVDFIVPVKYFFFSVSNIS